MTSTWRSSCSAASSSRPALASQWVASDSRMSCVSKILNKRWSRTSRSRQSVLEKLVSRVVPRPICGVILAHPCSSSTPVLIGRNHLAMSDVPIPDEAGPAADAQNGGPAPGPNLLTKGLIVAIGAARPTHQHNGPITLGRWTLFPTSRVLYSHFQAHDPVRGHRGTSTRPRNDNRRPPGSEDLRW